MNFIKQFISRFFHIHNFENWEKYKSGEITQDGVRVGLYLYQFRVCEECGYVQVKKDTF